MYSRILVPIDGSRTADRGLIEAIRLAKDQKAKLRLLYVVDEAFLTYDSVGYWGDVNHDLREGGQVLVARAREMAHAQGVESETAVVETKTRRVADRILDDAREWGADLIVMGTHGRRGLTNLVMGSDAEAVLRGSMAPVLLVRALGAKEDEERSLLQDRAGLRVSHAWPGGAAPR